MKRFHSLHKNPAKRQAGLTLIELMVSMTIGLIMLAALVTLIADQSSNRGEIDKSGKMIENGRYAIQTMAADIQMAGFWGEFNPPASTVTVLPDPCSTDVGVLDGALPFHIQGYNDPVTLPSDLAACVSEHKPGTDVLVVRRADTGTVLKADAEANQIYIQSGLQAPIGLDFLHRLADGSDAADPTVGFIYKKKNLTTDADLRKVLVNIYYISKCSVPVSNSCTAGDDGTPIPTLKLVQLSKGAGGPVFTTESIAEGIENLQIDYGVDSDGTDGAPDGGDVNGSALAPANWQNVMSLKLHLLARSTEKTPGYQDKKSYVLGTAGAASAASDNTQYKHHVFVQSVRLVNPSGRRKF